MSDHDCIHEQDFGILFTKVDLMTESFKIMRTSNEALKTAVDATLKYQWTMESIAKNRKERKEWTMQKAIFYSSLILGCSGLLITIIIKFI